MSDVLNWVVRVGSRAIRDVARLVVPVCCPGCGRDDVRWCDECEAAWWEAPFRAEGDAPRLHRLGQVDLPVWSLVSLDGSPQSVIEAWKDADRRDLDPMFRGAIARGAAAVTSSVATANRIAVVPVPARPASTHRRGVDLPVLLAAAVVDQWRGEGLDAAVRRSLTMKRAESRGLSARQRWRSAQQSMRMIDPPDLSRAVVLIDDVMTTGATIATARDCLERAGAVVCAAITLAAAPMRGERPSMGLGWDEEADDSSDTFDGRGGDGAGAVGAADPMPRAPSAT
jgi:predicted amidophosphoribosyltransferase